MSGSTAEAAPAQRVRIGDYILAEEIGKGSFATVYKGYRAANRQTVAVKAVARQKLTPKLLENLEGEISILKNISHPHVVELSDCIKNEHHIYLIMAFCSGGDLSVYIKKRGRLPSLEYRPDPQGPAVFWPHPKEGGLDETVARCFLGQLAEALKFLRQKNLIHRDIKPQNLLLHPPTQAQFAEGHPLGIPILKVADFGFARFLPSTDLASTLCGSPLYMAPEILRYEKYDAKADLWSVGAVLYEMMVGRPPFRAQNHVELLKKIEKGEDRIKFPDESSRNRTEDDSKDADGQVERPVPVARDVKELIRRLLKRVPVQRMSFEDFFASHVWEGFMRRAGPTNAKADSEATAQEAVSRGYGTVAKRERKLAHTPPAALSGSRRIHEPRYYVGGEDRGTGGSPAASLGPAAGSTEVVIRRTPSASPPVASPGARLPEVRESPQEDSGPRMPDSRSLEGSKVEGNEYVIVEKRAVEVNSLADEFNAAAIRPGIPSRRRSSRSSALGRPLSTLVSSPQTSRLSPSSQFPPYGIGQSPPFATNRPVIQPGPSSPGANANSRPILVPQPNRSLSDRVTGGYAMPPSTGEWKSSGSPGAVHNTGLTRVISNASLRWIASPVNAIQNLAKPPWKRRVAARFEVDRITAEDALLDALDDLARKASILAEFGDSKLQICTNALAGAGQGGSSLGEHIMGSGPNYSEQPANRRRSSSASISSADLLPARLEVLCAESLILYMKALAYLQKGMEAIRQFWQDTRGGVATVASSADVNETVQWFRKQFNDCFEKAQWAKDRCNEEMPDSANFVEKLVYDKAIELSRSAAVNELIGDDLSVSEIGYESALWLLYAIMDPVFHEGQVLTEADRGMIGKVVASIQARLASLQEKVATITLPAQ